VLDGVATPAMRSTLDVWPSREVALAAVIDACKETPSCASAHPDLAAKLDAIRDSLGTNGREMNVSDPRTGESQALHMTFEQVIAALQPFTYAPELAALLPEVIGRAAAGDFGPLYAGAMLVTGDLDEQSNTALHYSVTCAEDVARVSADDSARTLATLRTKSLAERALSVCTAWPKGVAPSDATAPVKSDVPVLILSGGLDPVTPPANGAEVAKSLPASRHIVARGYGHIVSPHACGPRLIAAFIDDPTFETLPASCIEHFEKSRRPPLWPDRLGARS
jgi:pimeloyl-ACP methyl ester carboxylesterase